MSDNRLHYTRSIHPIKDCLIMDKSTPELLSDIECPFKFKPLMAQGDGSPLGRSRDLIRFDDSRDRSNISSELGDESFEAFGGNSSVVDPCDLKSEIAQLKFKIQKLNEDCADLRVQNSAYQDENMQLSSEKADLERKLAGRDLAQERIKQLQKQLEEAIKSLSSTEDLNSILRTKNHRLEKDCWELEEKAKTLMIDCNRTGAELERSYAKLKQKEDEIQRIKSASEDLVEKWRTKQVWMENHVTDINETVEELTRSNLQLRKEKFELEHNLVDLAGNHLVHLNSSAGSPDEASSSRSGSPSSPRCSMYSTPQSYLGRSLHAEIAATIERKRSIQMDSPPIPFHQISTELVDAFTQSEFSEESSYDEGFWGSEKRPVSADGRQELHQILVLIRKLRAMIFKRSVDEDLEDEDLVMGDKSNSSGHLQDEMARHVNQQLEDFKKQLSQELSHVMQTNGPISTLNLDNVTQSCPLLADPFVITKPSLVTCSTQTDPLLNESGSSQQDAPAPSLLNEGDNYSDKLSDDTSYRLALNLSTVLEESFDQETETSPGSGPRRMSSIERNRRKAKLLRSPAADEDPSLESFHSIHSSHHHNGSNGGSVQGAGDDAASSENDFQSAASSLPGSVYNSLERPLQITGAYTGYRNGNGDSDSLSVVSDGTFGSPLSYPSSPTYWTPLEGSSSQETITNIDGDKTPVNGDDRLEVLSCPVPRKTEYENGTGSLKQRGSGRSFSSCGPSLPIYNQNESSSVGVIPESHREHMIKYAFDPVRRSSELEARILNGPEWRTLHSDLDKKDQHNYRKGFAQDYENDIEGGLHVESGSQRPAAPDLEEDAEECLERFPGLVEKLFMDLDVFKRTQKSPADFDLETISTRFNHLAHTFKVEHCNLTQRKDINLTNHEHATTKVETIIESLTEVVQKFEDATNKTKMPDDIAELILSLKHIPGDLDIYSHELSKTSRRVGMMDVQVRLYKMIEVMVLYVHILRNLCSEKDKDIHSARKLLEKNSIPYTRIKTVATMGNNNNNDKELCDEGNDGDFQRDNEDDGRPKQLLQHLLGPKKSDADLDYKLREKLVLRERSSTNPIIRLVSDAYETARCELFWPWTWDDTWKGIKQGFSFTLMILGVIIILRSLFPIVSANDPPPVTDLGSLFSKHGKLDHPVIPEI